jgi:D-sedoheptulose 7-phosphate isomerase
MQGELEAYFATLGALGGRILATDRAGASLTSAEAITRFVAECERVKRDQARVFFIGNGGSAAIASHMAIDWMKNGGFAASAFNDSALLTCLSNDLGYEQVFALPLRRHASRGDLLIAISSSGQSANILAGVEVARNNGVTVITMSGFSPDNPLRRCGNLNFYVPNQLYGFVEISHLTLCHAVLDIVMGWRASGRDPVYSENATERTA